MRVNQGWQLSSQLLRQQFLLCQSPELVIELVHKDSIFLRIKRPDSLKDCFSEYLLNTSFKHFICIILYNNPTRQVLCSHFIQRWRNQGTGRLHNLSKGSHLGSGGSRLKLKKSSSRISILNHSSLHSLSPTYFFLFSLESTTIIPSLSAPTEITFPTSQMTSTWLKCNDQF